MNNSTKKTVIYSVLATFALVFFVVENLFPPIFVPGAKLGLSNIFILIALILFGVKGATLVCLVKITIGSLILGNFFSIVFSLPASIFALFTEFLLINFSNKFSVISISVVGALVNSIVQNLVYCIVYGNLLLISFLPYLALISVISGLIVGVAVFLTIKFVPFNNFLNVDCNI